MIHLRKLSKYQLIVPCILLRFFFIRLSGFGRLTLFLNSLYEENMSFGFGSTKKIYFFKLLNNVMFSSVQFKLYLHNCIYIIVFMLYSSYICYCIEQVYWHIISPCCLSRQFDTTLTWVSLIVFCDLLF